MNPGNRYDKPGKAPDGMDLVPVYEEESPGAVRPGRDRVRAGKDHRRSGCR